MRKGAWFRLALPLGAGFFFAVLATMMVTGGTAAVDAAILLWLDARAAPWMDKVALEVTALGGIAVVVMVLLLATALFAVTGHNYSAVTLWIAYFGGSLVTATLKAFFDRPRPQLFEWRTPMANHASFPSGHAATSVAVYATLAYLIVRLEPTPALRRTTFAIAAAVILLIGASRVYLGVHYPSDVLAGYAVGLAWATICVLTIDVLRDRKKRTNGE